MSGWRFGSQPGTQNGRGGLPHVRRKIDEFGSPEALVDAIVATIPHRPIPMALSLRLVEAPLVPAAEEWADDIMRTRYSPEHPT